MPLAWILLAALVVAVLVGLDRLLRRAETRGWIYYRTRRPPPGAAAERLMELGTIWDPSAAHALEERDRLEDDRETPGDRSDD